MDLDQLLAIWLQRDVLALLSLGALSVGLWRLPVIGWLFYPFQLLNTFVHELSHLLALIVTGGTFRRIDIYANKEGLTVWRVGGVTWIIASAGYLGSAVFGGLLLLLAASEVAAKGVLMGLGMGLALLNLGFVRNLYGILAGLLLAGTLYAAGLLLDERLAEPLLLLLAVQMILSALHMLLILMRLSTYPPIRGRENDAQLVAGELGCSPIFWALLWFLIALGILAWSVTRAYAPPA